MNESTSRINSIPVNNGKYSYKSEIFLSLVNDPTVLYNGAPADYEDYADYLRINTRRVVMVG